MPSIKYHWNNTNYHSSDCTEKERKCKHLGTTGYFLRNKNSFRVIFLSHLNIEYRFFESRSIILHFWKKKKKKTCIHFVTISIELLSRKSSMIKLLQKTPSKISCWMMNVLLCPPYSMSSLATWVRLCKESIPISQ